MESDRRHGTVHPRTSPRAWSPLHGGRYRARVSFRVRDLVSRCPCGWDSPTASVAYNQAATRLVAVENREHSTRWKEPGARRVGNRGSLEHLIALEFHSLFFSAKGLASTAWRRIL